MFYAKNEGAARFESFVDLRYQRREIFEIMESERTNTNIVDDVGLEFDGFQIGLEIGNGRIFGEILSLCQHVRGYIDSQHRLSAGFASPSTEPSKATPKIENFRSPNIWDHSTKFWPLWTTVKPLHLARKLDVSFEELAVIIDILGTNWSSHGWVLEISRV